MVRLYRGQTPAIGHDLSKSESSSTGKCLFWWRDLNLVYECVIKWYKQALMTDLVKMILLVIFGASTLPNRGKHVTQQGQARYPDWADFISCLCPKCLSKSDHWVVCFMTAFIITDNVNMWCRCVPRLRQGHWLNTEWQYQGAYSVHLPAAMDKNLNTDDTDTDLALQWFF